MGTETYEGIFHCVKPVSEKLSVRSET